MYPEAIKDILRSALSIDSFEDYKRSSTIQISCPLAQWTHAKGSDRSPSMSITYSNVAETKYRCWSCKERGIFCDLFKLLHHFTEEEKFQKLYEYLLINDKPRLIDKLNHALDKPLVREEEKSFISLAGSTLKNFIPAFEHPRGQDYLLNGRKRVFSKQLCEEFSLLYDMNKDAIVFPVKDIKGNLLGGVARPIEGPSRYHNYFGLESEKCLGGIDKYKESTKGILLVEGYFDLLNNYYFCQENNLSIFCTFKADVGKGQAEQLISLDKNTFLVYDMDKAGNNGADKAIKKYKSYLRIKRLEFPEEYDPGTFSKEIFLSTIKDLRTF